MYSRMELQQEALIVPVDSVVVKIIPQVYVALAEVLEGDALDAVQNTAM